MFCSVEFCCDEHGREIASGDIYDNDYHGGRFGVYVLSQEIVTFSHVNYSCSAGSVSAIGESAVLTLVNSAILLAWITNYNSKEWMDTSIYQLGHILSGTPGTFCMNTYLEGEVVIRVIFATALL